MPVKSRVPKKRFFWFMGHQIRVRLVAGMPDAWGSHVIGTDVIQVARDQTVANRTEVLCHEWLHVAFEKLGLWQKMSGRSSAEKHATEEAFVDVLSPALVSFLRDNNVDLSPLEKIVR